MHVAAAAACCAAASSSSQQQQQQPAAARSQQQQQQQHACWVMDAGSVMHACQLLLMRACVRRAYYDRVAGLSPPLSKIVERNLGYGMVRASPYHSPDYLLQSCSGAEIGLRHDHSKTGSFSVFSRFCPLKYKIYIVYRYFYFLPG